MSERAPYQVLVFPYFKSKEQELEYCIFRRKDMGAWQGVAGGGEVGETPLESAKRETFEEAGITSDNRFVQLSSISSVPVEAISGFGGAPFKTRNKAINYNLLLKKSFEKIGRENYEDNLHVFYAGI